jgi:hypothetical protein
MRGDGLDSSHRSWLQQLPGGSSIPRTVDHDLTQGLQHLSLVVIKVAVDLTDTLLLHHPQLAVGFCDEARIVADNDHSFGGRTNQERESGVEEEEAQQLQLPLSEHLPPL